VRFFGGGQRKVRTPQSSVPDNVREGEFKFTRRKVPQKTYRPAHSGRGVWFADASSGMGGVRVKRCGKSAPPRQQCSGQGKPHTEQDQIGRNPAHSGKSTVEQEALSRMGGNVPARCVKPPGRSLEPRSDARPRGMAVPQEQSCGQNSAYRSGCHVFYF